MKIYLKLFIVIALGLFVTSFAFADETAVEAQPEAETAGGVLKGIEVMTGFGWNKLKAKSDFDSKPDYNMYPIVVDFDFNLKDLTKKIGINPPSLIEFQLEPYIAPVSSPSANVEVGNSFMLKVGLLPETSKFQPFIKGGVGMVYMSTGTQEQGSKFNFIESGAVGAHFFFTKNTSLVTEFRYRHLSNCGIEEPNSGINTYQALAGVSYKF